jgi:hypothetical protein
MQFRFHGSFQWTGERREVFYFREWRWSPAVVQMLNALATLSMPMSIKIGFIQQN